MDTFEQLKADYRKQPLDVIEMAIQFNREALEKHTQAGNKDKMQTGIMIMEALYAVREEKTQAQPQKRYRMVFSYNHLMALGDGSIVGLSKEDVL
jgi:hypothetical protein